MIRVTASIVDSDAVTVTAEFYFEDDGTDGIDRVRVLTAAGIEVPVPQPSRCPGIHRAATGPVARTDLPLLAEAVDCAGVLTPVEENGTFFINDTAPFPGPGTPMPCSSALLCPPDPACDEAVGTATRLYRDMVTRCRACHRIRTAWEWKIQEAVGWATLALIFAVMIVILTPFIASTGWFGLLFLALMAAALAGFGYATWEAQRASLAADRLREELEECERNLASLRTRAREALDTALATCCPGCADLPGDLPC